MFRLPAIRSAWGVLAGLAASVVFASDTRAEHDRGFCGSEYVSVRYLPSRYSQRAVFVEEPTVLVQRVRPRSIVGYRSWTMPRRYSFRRSLHRQFPFYVMRSSPGHHLSRHGFHLDTARRYRHGRSHGFSLRLHR